MNEPTDFRRLLSPIEGPRSMPEASRHRMREQVLDAYDRFAAEESHDEVRATNDALFFALGSVDDQGRWSIAGSDVSADDGSTSEGKVPRRANWTIMTRVAAGLLLIGAVGALLAVRSEPDPPTPDVDAVALATGLDIGPGVYRADEFPAPFSFTTTTNWEVLRAARTSIRIADPSSTSDDLRTVTFSWIDDEDPAVADLEVWFENPPAGVTVEPLAPIEISGREGLRTTVVVSADAPCIPSDEDNLGCVVFPFAGEQLDQLNRSRIYDFVATEHPQSAENTPDSRSGFMLVTAATTTRGDGDDPWRTHALDVIDSIVFIDRDG